MSTLEQTRLLKSGSRSQYPRSLVPILIRGIQFTLDRQLLAAKSGKISSLLKSNPQADLSSFFRDLPSDITTIELVVKFCHNIEINISARNVVPVSCLAYYLEMTDKQSPGNLLNMALRLFEDRVLPSWNETLKAVKASERVFRRAMDPGLVKACLESLVEKAIMNPRLLGEPINHSIYDDEDEDDNEFVSHKKYKINARKRLFVPDCKSEDLTNLSLRFYKPLMAEMSLRQVHVEYLAANLCQYAKKWAFTCRTRTENHNSLINKKRDSPREVIETIERLLPHQKGLLPCSLLFEMLRFAIVLEASVECRQGFETRIGKQLDMAMVKDFLIPTLGYAKEMQYDIECVKRIVKHFYASYNGSDNYGLIKVAELIEGFLAEIASDIDLKHDTFISVAEMSNAASSGTNLCSDKVYYAIDLYLDKHRYLTESEKENVCSLLDCERMSSDACQHAAKNKLLPLRVVVQILFARQLQLRGTVMKENEDRMVKVENRGKELAIMGCGEEEARSEMDRMGSNMLEPKRECHLIRTEIQNGYNHRLKKEKVSVWTEMKRKFGCLNIAHDPDHDLRETMKKKMKAAHPK